MVYILESPGGPAIDLHQLLTRRVATMIKVPCLAVNVLHHVAMGQNPNRTPSEHPNPH